MTSPSQLAPYDIVSYGLVAPEDWHPVPLDSRSATTPWARELVTSLAPEGEFRDEATAQLDDLRLRLVMQNDPYFSAAVFLPRVDRGIIDALMTYRPIEREGDDSPAAFLREAETQRNRREPGLVIRDVSTWQETIAAGEVAGMRTVNSYRELGAEFGWVEERTVFGVYPPNANQSIVITFTTSLMDTFADMRAETFEIVKTLTVDLGPAT
jgi:hypothetical protein